MITLINDKFIADKLAKIEITSDMLLGYGIFETLRTYNKEIIFNTTDHIDRLLDSAKKIDLKIQFNKKEIFKMLKKIAKKSIHKNQKIKIIAIPNKLIITSTEQKDDKKIYQGVKCMSIICQRSLPEIKSISYLSSLLSHKKAEEKGYFEAILINEKGEVSEGAYSNIFWFEKNILCTTKNKILLGITRKTVLKISPFKTKLKTINIKNLYKTKEIFLTSSTKGIVPVVQIDNKKIGNGLVGDKSKELICLLNNLNSL